MNETERPEAVDMEAERDLLWSSLQALNKEIAQLAAGKFDSSERQQKLVALVARIVLAEMAFRAQPQAQA
jgi:hypothetical protein